MSHTPVAQDAHKSARWRVNQHNEHIVECAGCGYTGWMSTLAVDGDKECPYCDSQMENSCTNPDPPSAE